MDKFFSIGELAKYQNISKQTLIFYDKIGLFHPAYVDPANGYRYYSSKQLDSLDTILIMKKIGFSLNEIREYMQHYNIDTSLNALKKQLTVIDDQIQELQMIRSRVVNRCEQMEQARKYKEKGSEIVTENTEAQYIFFQEVEKPYSLGEISIATKKCFALSFQKKLPTYFQSGVMVPLRHILERRYTEATLAFLPMEKGTSAANVKRLPAGRCVSLLHIGTYESIGRSYEKLLSYCRTHSLEIISDSYEFCINDYLTSFDENEYITKILFYVRERLEATFSSNIA